MAYQAALEESRRGSEAADARAEALRAEVAEQHRAVEQVNFNCNMRLCRGERSVC
jgi:hypothetical protein